MLSSFLISLCLVNIPISAEIKNFDQVVPQHEISLLGFIDGKPTYSQRMKTNKKGIATFEVSKPDNVTFIFRTIFQDIEYISDFIDGNHPPQKPIPISVYEQRTSDPGLYIRERSLFFTWADNALLVEDEIIIENASRYSIVGPSNKENPETFRLTLPTGAHDLRFALGFSEEETRFEKNDIVVSTPFIPGLSRFSVKYAIETTKQNFHFDSKLSLPVKKITLGTTIRDFRPANVEGGWISEGSKLFGDRTAYLWSLANPETIESGFRLQGLPRVIHWPSFVPFVLLALLLGLASILGRRQKHSDHSGSKQNLLRELAQARLLLERKVITPTEYHLRRFDLLSKLAPFYSHAHNINTSGNKT